MTHSANSKTIELKVSWPCTPFYRVLPHLIDSSPIPYHTIGSYFRHHLWQAEEPNPQKSWLGWTTALRHHLLSHHRCGTVFHRNPGSSSFHDSQSLKNLTQGKSWLLGPLTHQRAPPKRLSAKPKRELAPRAALKRAPLVVRLRAISPRRATVP